MPLDLTLTELHGQEVRTTACATLHQPPPQEAKTALTQQCHEATALAQHRLAGDTRAESPAWNLKLKRDDTVASPAAVPALQKVNQEWPFFDNPLAQKCPKYCPKKDANSS